MMMKKRNDNYSAFKVNRIVKIDRTDKGSSKKRFSKSILESFRLLGVKRILAMEYWDYLCAKILIKITKKKNIK